MSFFSSIKRALGFGDDYEECDDTVASNAGSDDETENASADNTAQALQDVAVPAIDPDIKARIFEGAVAVFNEALPDFLRRSVDPELQRKRLVEALDKGVDEYLNQLMHTAEAYAESRLRSAADSSRRESERLRGEMENLEHQRSALREQQLSADRRRRALADRVTDLESQLAKAEAEREQFELENRSLLNKLKVADIQPSVVEDMSKEIESLRKQLKEGAPAPDIETDAGLQARLDEAITARHEAEKQLGNASREAAEAADGCRKALKVLPYATTDAAADVQRFAVAICSRA